MLVPVLWGPAGYSARGAVLLTRPIEGASSLDRAALAAAGYDPDRVVVVRHRRGLQLGPGALVAVELPRRVRVGGPDGPAFQGLVARYVGGARTYATAPMTTGLKPRANGQDPPTS